MSADSLVPLPLEVEFAGGAPFAIDPLTTMTVAEGTAPSLPEVLSQIARIPLGGVDSPICFSVQPDADLPPSDEAYQIEVNNEGISVLAAAEAGLVRAASTLAQLPEVDDQGRTVIPAVRIIDAPRYPWRGFSMDVARSFYPASEIKRLIDLLTFYRMNTLHLHLTDDQGWRIEIPSRPELAQVSGATAVDGGRSGFYTTEEYRDLVDYAAARHVEIVPEIDVPGHINAATHVYGELLPDGKPTDQYSGSRVGFSRLYADLPATKDFLDDVFGDIADMTPGTHIHIGGDEASELNAEEYSQLMEMIIDSAAKKGHKVVGWQEVATAELPADAIVQYWDINGSKDHMKQAAAKGIKFLISPGDRTYLDMQHNEEETHLGQHWAGYIELRDAYEWDPAEQLEGVEDDSIAGIEATMWTETIPQYDDLTYMLVPRLPALAEVGWSARDRREWDDFAERIANHADFWEDSKTNWHRSPGIGWSSK